MSPGDELVHYNARRPYICFLGVCEHITDLFWRFVEESSAFQEVRDRRHNVILACEAEVDDLHLRQIVIVTNQYIFWFQVAMDNILHIMQVGDALQQALHDLRALLFGEGTFEIFLMCFREVA